MTINFYKDMDIFRNETAIISEESGFFTYSDLISNADNLADKIDKRCLIFCLCENCAESIVGYIGFLRQRIVPVMLNVGINNDLFDTLLQTYRPTYIWLPSEKVKSANWGSIIHQFGNYVLLKTFYVTEYKMHDELALLLTTSGSTGSPKLVRLSYKNINANADSISKYLSITHMDKPITTLPMSYSYGLSIINSHLLKGAAIILTNKTLMDRAFWGFLKREEATTFGGVPYIYEMLKKLRFAGMQVPSLKVLTQAGGKLNPDLAKEFAFICQQKGIRFFVMYGQTEATARMSYLPSEYAITKAGSMGNAIPGGEFWLEDEHGNTIEECDKVGELIFKGDNVSMGYADNYMDLHKEDENNGVLRTGDMAKRDVDGFYYIVGRKKRFLKLFGNRVNLDELDNLIKRDGINCVCSGVDDHLRIYTDMKNNHDMIKKMISGYTGINTSGFEVIYIDTIPRNDAGKILYSELK